MSHDLRMLFNDNINNAIDTTPHLVMYSNNKKEGFLRYFQSWCNKLNIPLNADFDIMQLRDNEDLQLLFIILVQYYFGY